MQKTAHKNTQPPLLQQGFTLVEVMVVVVILSVTAGLVALSVNGGKARKNRAFYEHFIDSMDYIRLVSAERMQPMGIRIIKDDQGQFVPQVVQLENAYAHYQLQAQKNTTNRSKNTMELSANIRSNSNSNAASDNKKPAWIEETEIELPKIPDGVNLEFVPLEQSVSTQNLQPWFVGQEVPSVLWYGTGQATVVNIEIKYKDRLVGDVIQLLADGSVKVEGKAVAD